MTRTATTDNANYMRFAVLLAMGFALVGAPAFTGPSLAASAADQALPSAAELEALRSADLRLATVGFRLATDNVALCRDRKPGIGIQIHSLRQYDPAVRPLARQVFGFATAVAVEGVIPGGPADRAGIVADESLIAFTGQRLTIDLPTDDKPADTIRRDQAEAILESLPPDQPVRVRVRRGGIEQPIIVRPEPACRSRFELLIRNDYQSTSDGQIIQISTRIMNEFDDRELAVIVAHELAHIILRHRARLEAAGATWGIFSDFGKSLPLHRRAESEADRLSVYLLANAGYDRWSPGKFWRGKGRRFDPGIFRNRAYPGWKMRAAMLDAEAANIGDAPSRPVIPAMLNVRDQPM